MSKTLELRFSSSEGKANTLVVQDPKPDLDALTVQNAMNQLVQQNLFERNGMDQHATIKSARYVERITTDVFEITE